MSDETIFFVHNGKNYECNARAGQYWEIPQGTLPHRRFVLQQAGVTWHQWGSRTGETSPPDNLAAFGRLVV